MGTCSNCRRVVEDSTLNHGYVGNTVAVRWCPDCTEKLTEGKERRRITFPVNETEDTEESEG